MQNETALEAIETAEAGFITKAAQKKVLEKISRTYEKKHYGVVMNAILNARTVTRGNTQEEWDTYHASEEGIQNNEDYYTLTSNLHHVKEKHLKIVDKYAAEHRSDIVALRTARDIVKNTAVVKINKEDVAGKVVNDLIAKFPKITNELLAVIKAVEDSVRPQLEKQMEAKFELAMSYQAVRAELRVEAVAAKDGTWKDANRLRWLLEAKGFNDSFIAQYCDRKENSLREVLQRDLECSLGKIKIAILKKFEEVGDVVSVENVYMNVTDFVEGTWILTKADGSTKRLTIESILAGGYNIQCLHVRTLYKIR